MLRNNFEQDNVFPRIILMLVYSDGSHSLHDERNHSLNLQPIVTGKRQLVLQRQGVERSSD